jgi:hypothetical protein
MNDYNVMLKAKTEASLHKMLFQNEQHADYSARRMMRCMQSIYLNRAKAIRAELKTRS